MEVKVDVQDGRQRSFQPTDKTLREAAQLIKSCLLPAQMIFPYVGSSPRLEMSPDLLKVFARGFAKILESDLLLDKILPEAKWMLNRDGGHLPMLALYADALRNGSLETGYNVSSYVQISSRLGVSKTHVQRMIREGEQQGYFKCNKRTVKLSPAFVELMRRAMSIYFSISRVSVELGVVDYDSGRVAVDLRNI